MRPSAKIDIQDDDDVEEPHAKRQRRVMTPSALEDVVPHSRLRTRKPEHARFRLAETHARRKWGSSTKLPLEIAKERTLKEGEEGKYETETETSDQRLQSLDQPDSTSRKDLWPSEERSLNIPSVTVEFDTSKGPLAYQPKAEELSLSDLLSERIVLLMKYLDQKMVKYSVPASLMGSYVELVHRRTKAKAAATDGVTERIKILTFEWRPR
ncbi:hypothetical protein AXG93_2839s1520 [Marchantia polymorpha subsp. ruderalis]|uniref:Uncharacterized protein n=1 Tax=Marchantia polymorpha subsp. ruderalis TaxID=1480154 RepID=A0A176VH00_MARPO|nr:hypothetical protein AXG93_2839s1520 [Marchantia polymorpha subsp. ruderalis]